MRFGSARVATDDQDLDLQQAVPEAAGCMKIFGDRIAGVARKRLDLDRALKACAADGALIAYLTPTLLPPLRGGDGGAPARQRRGG